MNLLIAALIALPAFASSGDLVRHVRKGASITIISFNDKVHGVLLTINSEKAVGPNYAEVKPLLKAIDSQDSENEFMKKKNDLKGAVFQLKSELPLLSENEVDRRRSKK
jgi:hypothetical protein